MSTPYLRSYWDVPSSSSSSHSKPIIRGIPVATPKQKSSPKVVSIPVHFVGSERKRSDSALKIQKVLRGFLVRKSLKKIAAISNEVNQIERTISDHETIDLIRRDSRERLRINEMLMNLLLRLDSVTTVDFGVRGCRKSVIKKAIALQEKLDVIAFASTRDSRAQDQGRVEVEENTNVVSQEASSDLHEEAGDCSRSEGTYELQSLVKQDGEVMAVERTSELRENVEAMPVCVPSDSEVSLENSGQEKENGAKETPEDQFLNDDYAGTSLAREQSGTRETAGTASVEEGTVINLSPETEGRDLVTGECEEPVRDDGRKEEQSLDRELLHRMIEDNERMMGLMAELYERNAIQTRVLTSLSERVMQLEKAYACEKLRKKKRRNAASNTGDSHKMPDTKKFDKKH